MPSLSLSLRLWLIFGLSSTLFYATNARSHTDVQVRHHRRIPQPGPENSTVVDLEKRGGDKRFSWYPTGLGACGGVNGPDDFIVALNTPQWDGGSHCYESITITYQGKTAQAQIVDRCVECPPGALDFSHGLFAYFAGNPEQVGIIYGDWSYGSGDPKPSPTPDPKPDPPKQHTPDPTPDPTPEPTPEPTTSTSTRRRSSSSSAAPTTSSSTSSTVSSSSSVSSVSSTTSAAPSQSPTPSEPQVLELINLAMVQLGGVAMAGLTVQA